MFNYIFAKWWRPVLLWVLACVMYLVSEFLTDGTFQYAVFLLLGITALFLLFSSFLLISQRKKKEGILSLVIFGIATFGIVLYTALGAGVKEGKQREAINEVLHIPADLDYDRNRPDSITNRKVAETEFQLYNSFQPGLYRFDFWTGKIESGTIYLKAYEIPGERPLSSDRLPKSSSLKLYNPTDSIRKFGLDADFTIYEGDWGKPYAARFEVWFIPDNGGAERKLFSKNYEIEGWMR